MKATRPPRRAAATAWLAPFPPGFMKKVPPMTVSPGAGRCSVRMTMSVLELPTTRMLCVDIGSYVFFVCGGCAIPAHRCRRRIGIFGTLAGTGRGAGGTFFRMRSAAAEKGNPGAKGGRAQAAAEESRFARSNGFLRVGRSALTPDICGHCGAAWRARRPPHPRTTAKCRPIRSRPPNRIRAVGAGSRWRRSAAECR